MMMKKATLLHKIFTKTSYLLCALVIVASNYQPASAIILNKDLIEHGITQYDNRVTADTSCSDTPQTASGGIVDGLNLGSEPKERRVNLIKAFMATFGLRAHQAAGIVGNFSQEAGSYEGDATPGIRPDINQGEHAGAPPNGGDLGYGWAQWSNPLPGVGRKTAFVTFLNNNPAWVTEGRATDTANINFLKKELDESYKSTLVELKKKTNPKDAAISFEATFERAGRPDMTNRILWANNSYDEYVAAGGGVDPSGGAASPASCDSGSVGTGQSATFGEVAFPLKGTKKVVLNPGMFHDGTSDLGGHPYTAYDIMTNAGTEVVAFAGGVVSYVGHSCDKEFVTIWNEQAKLGVSYMHMSSHIDVGTRVQPGDHVGIVGSSEYACDTDPHLHIDAAVDKIRQACDRYTCTIQSHFRSIGKDLYKTYEALPE